MEVFVCYQTVFCTEPLCLSTIRSLSHSPALTLLPQTSFPRPPSALFVNPGGNSYCLKVPPQLTCVLSPFTCPGLLPVDFFFLPALILIVLLLWRGFYQFQSWSIWHMLVHGPLASWGLFEEFAFLL